MPIRHAFEQKVFIRKRISLKYKALCPLSSRSASGRQRCHAGSISILHRKIRFSSACIVQKTVFSRLAAAGSGHRLPGKGSSSKRSLEESLPERIKRLGIPEVKYVSSFRGGCTYFQHAHSFGCCGGGLLADARFGARPRFQSDTRPGDACTHGSPIPVRGRTSATASHRPGHGLPCLPHGTGGRRQHQ